MRIFFGKISDKQEPAQLTEGYYHAKKDSIWFNGLALNDYVFVMSSRGVQLWQAKEWALEGTDQERLNFRIIFDKLGPIQEFIRLKYLKLNVDLIVKTSRSTAAHKKAFFPMQHEDGFTELLLLNPETYSNPDNYRKIRVLPVKETCIDNSYDLQIYYEGDVLKLYRVNNSDPDVIEKFIDNSRMLGKGQPLKDNTLSVVASEENVNKEISGLVSIKELYDAFMCKYNEESDKINYWLVNGYDTERITYCLKNDVFVMQFQYDDQRTPDVTRMLNRAKRISEGDKVLLFQQNRYYAWGTFKKADVEGSVTKKLGEQISNRISYDGEEVVVYEDAPCYFEDLRVTNGFNSIWGQRLAIEEWLDIDVNGISIPGIADQIEGITTDTIVKLKDASFFEKVKNALSNTVNSMNTMETKRPSPDSDRSLNRILYGPPGTGKTYNTINRSLEIINDDEVKKLDWNDRVAVKALFDKKLLEGQITFTTFHQSMSYEDFVEGIKPLKPSVGDTFVKYDVMPGIFSAICERAQSNFESSKAANKSKLVFETAFQKLQDEWEENPEIKFPLKTRGYDYTIIGFTNTSIQFKKASGGTSHTLSIGTLRKLYYGREYDFNSGVGIYYPGILKKLSEYSNKSEGQLGDGKVSTPAENEPKEVKKYVLIIDEINRGNISQIFGELITLLEEDKRYGKPEALEVMLPYSKTKFSVPSNLYVIGTMNTADRSVESLDTALRRRFSFEEMPPKYDLDELAYSVYGFTASDIMKTLNERLEKLLGKEHQIGHSYFILKENETPEQRISEGLYKNIIPLLQEYFYGDFAKMGLVLGKGFVRLKDQKWDPKKKESIFADFQHDNEDEFNTRAVYEIVDYRYDPVQEVDGEELTIESALNLLMKRPIVV